MATLHPMDTAPKDKIILAYCSHGADPYYDPTTRRLTAYGANVEGFGHGDDGWHAVHWTEPHEDGDWENGYVTIPGCWTLASVDTGIPVNPVMWLDVTQETEEIVASLGIPCAPDIARLR